MPLAYNFAVVLLLIASVFGAKDHRTGEGLALEGSSVDGASFASRSAGGQPDGPEIPAGWVEIKDGSKRSADEPRNLLTREGLDALMSTVKNGAREIVTEANGKVAEQLKTSQGLIKSAVEKFEAAAAIILKENWLRAAKIQEQMEALRVATGHGNFNGKVSAIPVGKCCCDFQSEVDVSKAKCAWHNALASANNETHPLEGRLNTFQCPSDQALEYTDLVKPSLTESADFIDAQRIDKLLLACARSPGWQARVRGATEMEPEASLDQAKRWKGQKIYPDKPSLRETFATKMRSVEARVQAILHEATVSPTGDYEGKARQDPNDKMQAQGTLLKQLPNSAQIAILISSPVDTPNLDSSELSKMPALSSSTSTPDESSVSVEPAAPAPGSIIDEDQDAGTERDAHLDDAFPWPDRDAPAPAPIIDDDQDARGVQDEPDVPAPAPIIDDDQDATHAELSSESTPDSGEIPSQSGEVSGVGSDNNRTLDVILAISPAQDFGASSTVEVASRERRIPEHVGADKTGAAAKLSDREMQAAAMMSSGVAVLRRESRGRRE